MTGVEPGVGLTLRDLLSGENRSIRESSGSETLVVRDALLARVLDLDDDAFLCGTHPRSLPPIEAADVVRRARGRLRRKRAIPVQRLRDEAFGRYLIRSWEKAVAALDDRAATVPALQNTDGDPLLITTDHFTIAPGARPAIEQELAALEDVEPSARGEEPAVYVFKQQGNPMHASWEATVIGRGVVSDGALAVESNSRRRADALRARIETACGNRLVHRAREHSDPRSLKAPHADAGPPPEPPAEAHDLIRQLKARHYADWADQPLPALGGKTPRAAVRHADGRAAVDVLLKDMEHLEQRSPGESAFGFSRIRRELRLDG